MFVPKNRENDWIFSTETGHLQLLFTLSNISRLILIGNEPSLEHFVYVRSNVVDREEMEKGLKDLVIALHPKMCFRSGVPEPLFLVYEDDVVCSVVLGKFVGAFSQARLVASFGEGVCETCDMGLGLERMRGMEGVEFRVDTSVLVHPYLTPMVSGLYLIVGSLNERIQQGFCPRALCLGVGGGALLSFLNNELGFEVVGVEVDEVVLSVARQYFGLNDGKSVRVVVGDAIEMIEKAACGVSIDGLDAKFDVVMVDLDSSEAISGISAPPPEFVRKSVFQVMKSFLHDHGVLVINVISPNKVFYGNLVRELQDVFHKVYEKDVENDGNVVLMATLSPAVSSDHNNAFFMRLKSVVSGTSKSEFADTVQKVQPDSHDHLFLPCAFSKRIWFKLKPLASLDGVLEIWERNSRIHNRGSESIDKVLQLAYNDVRYKLLSLKFKPTKNSVKAARRWQFGGIRYILLNSMNLWSHDDGCQWNNDLQFCTVPNSEFDVGEIRRIRIARNKKAPSLYLNENTFVTGKSKHFGFLEFASPEVAKIVAETMHNYLLFEHLLQVQIIPPERVHPKLWKGVNRYYKPMDWVRINPWTGEEKRKRKIEAAGIDYKCPEIVGSDVAAPKKIRFED
ncbi:S-adenosyl-L-methionine-dependent methyltransferases superfamily protein [Artemisia annua]|uniref:S-adenosyl-L-methionine-dependent methyltransferases superfamily protein n=1 Tax=Artemisia annua TaxID=35608 RepID=A0A2U1NP19_ARTAN|nr:S-adenosyl-L-methionine-dependent methyltransferases superfamily protein [Artemisia annua]